MRIGHLIRGALLAGAIGSLVGSLLLMAILSVTTAESALEAASGIFAGGLFAMLFALPVMLVAMLVLAVPVTLLLSRMPLPVLLRDAILILTATGAGLLLGPYAFGLGGERWPAAVYAASGAFILVLILHRWSDSWTAYQSAESPDE